MNKNYNAYEMLRRKYYQIEQCDLKRGIYINAQSVLTENTNT